MARNSGPLQVLYEDVATRSRSIVALAPDWPCRKGCDLCCRRLASIPELTEAEWRFLEEGFRGLDPSERRRIARRIDDLIALPPPLVCPFLDPRDGVCLVYDYRPSACRTYGFYVERDSGLYCRQVEERVENGELASVIWGNHAGIEARLTAFGPKRDMVSWFRDTGERGL